MKTCIVIPAKDEAKTIVGLIGQLKAAGNFDIIVVDDASADGTADLARAQGAVVLPQVRSQGAWLATQAGMRYACAKGHRRVITMDADGQHRVEDIPVLLSKADDADVVIGACLERGSWARLVAWKLFQKLTGVSVDDLTSGFRLYNEAALDILISRQASLLEYQDMGVLLMLRSARLKMVEVPVTMRRRENGVSRIFSSWGKVTYYMMVTLLLCLVKAIPEKKRKFTQRLEQGH